MTTPDGVTRARSALALLDAVLERPAAEREAWLREECSRDPALHAEVEALLAAHARAEGVLERAPVLGPEVPLAERLRGALGEAYELERELGRGGMATVFLCRERKHDRRVVLKVLDPTVAELWGPDRFLREVRIAAQLAHPNVVPLIDSGEADGLLYYVMPFLEGETLRARLRRAGPLPLREAIVLLRDVADALGHAHAQGVVHRDLKPDNVLVTGGHAFLLDFGIAKLLGDTEEAATLTAPGAAIGTRRYMAPEQAAGIDSADHRVDLYAWGLLACELLLAEAVRVGHEAADARRALPARAPGMPPALVELVADCLEADPAARPADMAAVLRRLDAVRVPRRASPGSRRWRALAALVPVAAVLGAVAFVRARASTLRDALPQPVAVGVLRNETGDSSLAGLGRLAGDWLTEGLQRTGRVQVVPWGAALQVEAQGGDEVARLRRETMAGTVVTGAIYAVGDSLRLQVQLADAVRGRLLATPPAVVVPRARAAAGLQALRDRVMGSIATLADDRLMAAPGIAQQPPTYAAYRLFDRGLTRFQAQHYDSAAADFRAAWALDTTFTAALVWAAKAHWNAGTYPAADSLAQAARAREAQLGEYHELWLRFVEGVLVGDNARALEAMRRAVVLAPATRAGFDLAVVATEMGRPQEALEALQRLDPERGELRGWSSYWTQLAHARHLTGDHRGELAAARSLATRFPDRRVAQVLEARALAAQGRLDALDSALAAWATLPPDTYWSQGGAMVVAGEELLARGRDADGLRYLERGERWLRARLAEVPADRGHRYWLANALYGAGRYAEAAPYAEALAREFPDRIRYRGLAALTAARGGDARAAERWLGLIPTYGRGEHTAFRARLAAVAGDGDRAIELLSTALSQGVDGYAWLHGYAARDFAGLRDDPRYRRLMGGGQ